MLEFSEDLTSILGERTMWRYVQSTGDLFLNDQYMETGYSGAVPNGKNNPDMECVKNVGPIPRGMYTIGPVIDKPTPVTLRLAADKPDYCNPPRSGFLIHGDNTTHTASQGCIILSRGMRQTIADSGDSRLMVVRDSVLSARHTTSGATRWRARSNQL
ncbi:MAG: DUF2778 domain-containing protein [Burkholderiales bacterium]|nr:DUF2778 domain-containing protein [Burkholderiales bacterium]